MIIKFIQFILVISLSINLLGAQDIEDKSVTKQIWLDYNPSFSLTEKLDIYGDIGARTIFPNEWYRFIIGPSFRYTLPKWILKNYYFNHGLHFGIRLFYTVNKDFSDRLEIRPFQGYRIAWPNRPRIILQHYVRLEERFDIQLSNWSNEFGLRIRYMAELILRLKGDWIPINDGVFVSFSIELFWNLSGVKQFNDVVRIIPGIGYEFSEDWQAAFHIGYFYTRNTVEDVFATNDIVFRFRLYHKLN